MISLESWNFSLNRGLTAPAACRRDFEAERRKGTAKRAFSGGRPVCGEAVIGLICKRGEAGSPPKLGASQVSSASQSTIKGKSRSTIKGTRVHDLRSRSIIYRPSSTILGKPTSMLRLRAVSRMRFSTSRARSSGLESRLDSKLGARFRVSVLYVRAGFGSL